MGVINVTPDSFSDGGRYLDPEAAVAHGLALAADGAAILDVGGESTRPGAGPVPVQEELRRVVPVIEALACAGGDFALSIDTTKMDVARAAMDAGARMVNDVSALRSDPSMAALVAERGAGCCLMHMRGEPRTMQDEPRYDDVVSDVKAFLEERLAFAVGEGVPEGKIWLDPGIGFGKTAAHNLELLRRLDEIVAIGLPVVVGTSRKSFLGKLTGGRAEGERLPGTIATSVLAWERGASVFRVHDVAAVVDALVVTAATVGSPIVGGNMIDEHDPPDPDDEIDGGGFDPEDEDEIAEPAVTVEITGLSLFTRHGVTPPERELGQRLLLDVTFELTDCDAMVTDRVEDTVDYADVCEQVALAAQERSYKTLERLCNAIAGRLMERYGADSVRVKATKPEPPIALPVQEVSVEVWREA